MTNAWDSLDELEPGDGLKIVEAGHKFAIWAYRGAGPKDKVYELKCLTHQVTLHHGTMPRDFARHHIEIHTPGWSHTGSWDLTDLKPGDGRRIVDNDHVFMVWVLHDRPLYRVECLSCHEQVHLATDGPRSYALWHTQNHEHIECISVTTCWSCQFHHPHRGTLSELLCSRVKREIPARATMTPQQPPPAWCPLRDGQEHVRIVRLAAIK